MKVVFVLIALVITLGAQAQQEIPLYEGNIPGNLATVNDEKSIHPEKGRPAVFNVTHPALVAFIPKVPGESKPAVIICPGGGYVKLTIEDGGYDVAKALADSGIVAFVF
jgi:acetyl esterase/lipase